MLSLTKLRPKGRHYYKRELGGPGVEKAGPAYWSENPELAGRWLGRGAAAIGLEGEAVSEAGFDRLFGSGADPRDGKALGRGWDPESEKAVAGYVLTFSPPKSVSVLWALGDERVASQVAGAQAAAVGAALAYLQDHAAFTRRGRAGVLQVDTEGYLAAAFEHRTSRAADPQLHWHVLVANKVRASDGKWLSLDGTELYRSQKAAGLVYKATLRAELIASLGLEWTPVDENGIAEVVGVPEGLAARWSARRDEVVGLGRQLVAEREVALGRSLSANERAAAYQIAAYRTRVPKVAGDEPTEVLRARWRAEARSWGYEPGLWMGRALERAYVADRRTFGRGAPEIDLGKVVEVLEERYATWGRAEAVEVIATLVPEWSGSAWRALTHIERAADALLRDPEVLCLAGPLPAEAPESLLRRDGMAAVEHHGAVRFTTRATLAREALVLEAAAAGVDAGVGVVPARLVADALSRSGLGDDQAEAVRHLLSGGERIVCLVGPAGTGKSRSLSAARAAWAAAGYRVVGLAPSAMAASVLADEAGIASDTLAKFLHDASDGWSGLTPRCVVVLDEASMARTADLAALVGHIEAAGVKLVLAGDDHQLGAVGAGGLFATLVADRGAAELSTVRRFTHAWERAASLRLRMGERSILPVYWRHGRILGGDREAIVDAAFTAWHRARTEGRSVVVMAPDNDTVDALALRARAARVAAGEVSGRAVPAGRQLVGVGDEVVTLRNDRRLRTETGEWVRNGSRWVIEELGADGGALLSSIEGHGRVLVPQTYVAEHLGLAYATTVHKAQGLTVDEGILIVEPSMAAESLYVGMTRGRAMNRALVVCEGEADHGRAWSTEPLEVMARVLTRPGTEASAHRVMRAELSRYEDRGLLAELVEEHNRHVDALAGPDRTRHIEALIPKADVAAARRRLWVAELEAFRAIAARELAEARSVEAEAPSLRAHLPGRMGEPARYRDRSRLTQAEYQLRKARQAEHEALSELSAARHGVPAAEKAAEELSAARRQQERRLAWLESNPQEWAWGQALAERLESAERANPKRRTRVLTKERSMEEPVLSRFPVPNVPETPTERILRHSGPQLERHVAHSNPDHHVRRGLGRSL